MIEAKRSGISAPLINTALYLLLALALLVLILVRTHGHFTYCLDDPYIHLALAERLRHGLYGLNAGEPASPSSSILWPLLFVPFAGTAIMPWLPLLLNLLCGLAAAWRLGALVAEIFGRGERNTGSRSSIALIAALLVPALNLLGLTYIGLEQTLQVVLCIACALAVVRTMRGELPPAWTLAAAVILPSVRYEGLLITLGLALALAGVRAWRAAAGVTLASIVVPAGFSLFLHRLGLPWFPLSVLVKSSYKFADQSSLPRRIAHLLLQTLRQSIFDLERLPQLVITILLVALAWKHRAARNLSFALGGAAFVGAVQVVLGPVGWFFRYEIYALAFTLLVLIAASALPAPDFVRGNDLGARSRDRALLDRSAHVSPVLLTGVAAIALIYLRPLVNVPRAALGIYEQQYQIGRLTGEFDHLSVAVNDLGWVAFRRTAEQYTLDLYGLGSLEAFRTKEKDRTPAWLDTITREHHVGLVAIYPEWFKGGVPANWTAVAKLCALDVDTSLGPVSQRVMLYRTAEADPAQTETAIQRWSTGLPSRVLLQRQPTSSSSSCQ